MKKVAASLVIVLMTSSLVFSDTSELTPSKEIKTGNQSVDSKDPTQPVKSDHSQVASDVRSTIEKLVMNGRAMEKYRKTDLRTCGEMMRDNQSVAESVRSRAMALPMKYFNLRVASIEVYSCVSCSDAAIEDCERVTESLEVTQ